MQAVFDDDPAPPSDLAALPTELDDVLLKALSTEKSERLESAILRRNELQAIYDGQ